jgi:MSHA biogenesis protein MshP
MKRRLQRGFSLISAIFLLLVLSVLGAFMVSISGAQYMTATGAALGTQAYYAARSGVEWGAGRINSTGGCPAGSPVLPAYAAFTVTVTCNTGGVATHTEGAAVYPIYRLEATAQLTGVPLGDPRYVSRTVRLIMTTAP